MRELVLSACFGPCSERGERGVHYIPAPPRPVDIFTSLSAKFECLRAMNGPVRGTGNANQQSFQQGI